MDFEIKYKSISWRWLSNVFAPIAVCMTIIAVTVFFSISITSESKSLILFKVYRHYCGSLGFNKHFKSQSAVKPNCTLIFTRCHKHNSGYVAFFQLI